MPAEWSSTRFAFLYHRLQLSPDWSVNKIILKRLPHGVTMKWKELHLYSNSLAQPNINIYYINWVVSVTKFNGAILWGVTMGKFSKVL